MSVPNAPNHRHFEASLAQTDETAAEGPSKSRLRCRASGLLTEWLVASGGGLAITTYTSGKLVLVGTSAGRLRFRTRRFPRPMGLAIEDDQLALAVQKRMLQFRLQADDEGGCYQLKREFDTGRIDAHDVAYGRRGIYFANTRYNCVARTSERKRFVHCWQPPFLEKIVARDRCHLNGLGMHDGRPAMATAFCESAERGGWRELDRYSGGVLIDIPGNRVVARGLCMPHSPRFAHDRWWLCNSGQGLLSVWNSQQEICEAFCPLPGFTRGLCVVGNHALVGLSRIREEHILDAPPIGQRQAQIVAGVALVDLRSAQQVGLLEFVGGGNEVYEVVFLPRQPRPDLQIAALESDDQGDSRK